MAWSGQRPHLRLSYSVVDVRMYIVYLMNHSCLIMPSQYWYSAVYLCLISFREKSILRCSVVRAQGGSLGNGNPPGEKEKGDISHTCHPMNPKN